MRVFKTYKQLQAAMARPETSKRAFRFIAERYGPAGFICSDCKQTIAFPFSGGGTGYGLDKGGNMTCYICCGARERAAMCDTGKATLYLSGGDCFGMKGSGAYEITDWPGQLRFKPWHVKRGNHNIAGRRYDSWFAGPDGFVWHGVTYGDNTQIHHCSRTKEKV